jgi:hypothetical protein
VFDVRAWGVGRGAEWERHPKSKAIIVEAAPRCWFEVISYLPYSTVYLRYRIELYRAFANREIEKSRTQPELGYRIREAHRATFVS